MAGGVAQGVGPEFKPQNCIYISTHFSNLIVNNAHFAKKCQKAIIFGTKRI
jgi:hypothetical protein